MPKSLDETGVIQVDGAWATSVKYVAEALGPNVGTVDLRFMQGRAEVGRVAVSREHLSELLGEENRSAIERHIANDADKYLPVVAGELRGRRLHYQEVTLATAAPRAAENSIAALPTSERVAEAKTEVRPEPPGDRAPDRERSNPEVTDTVDGDAAKRRRASQTQAAESSHPRGAPVPAHIAVKYLVKGNVYHFDDQTVAFVDKGISLTVKTHNRAIIQDLVEIAQAREWQGVTVSGTQAFRREAWKAAVVAGLAVSGYTPSEIERVAVDRERGRRATANASERVEEKTPSARAASESATPRAASGGSANVERAAARVRYGILIAHGEAPYRHDPHQSASYFVTLKDGGGHEHTAWGVGLKDALLESKTSAALNDLVGIRRMGSTPVTVVQRSVGEGGEVIARPIDAKRHQWEIEKAAYFAPRSGGPSQDHRPSIDSEKTAVPTTTGQPTQTLDTQALTREQEAAAAIRSAATTREELQLKYPELNKAVFRHLASHDQFAEAYVKSGLIRESDRAQVIAQMRERLASKLERGTVIREPDNKEVSTLIRRSVNRVAADIGRPPIEIQPRSSDPSTAAAVKREDVQVRA
jgi:hypothetical protein